MSRVRTYSPKGDVQWETKGRKIRQRVRNRRRQNSRNRQRGKRRNKGQGAMVDLWILPAGRMMTPGAGIWMPGVITTEYLMQRFLCPRFHSSARLSLRDRAISVCSLLVAHLNAVQPSPISLEFQDHGLILFC